MRLRTWIGLVVLVPVVLPAQQQQPQCTRVDVPVTYGIGVASPTVSSSVNLPSGVFLNTPTADPKTNTVFVTISRAFNPPLNLCPGFVPPTLPAMQNALLIATFTWNLSYSGTATGYAYAKASAANFSPGFNTVTVTSTGLSPDPVVSSGAASALLAVNFLGLQTYDVTLESGGWARGGTGYRGATSNSSLTIIGGWQAQSGIAASMNPSLLSGYTEYLPYSVVVPEPSTLLLLIAPLAGVMATRTRRRAS